MLIQPKSISTGGATTFTGLTDTPSAITPKQYLVGNTAGTSLEFRSVGRVDVRDYVLVNDGKCIRSGSITASDNTLTDTYALGLFAAGDAGKTIMVKGAGVAGAILTTTIASVTNSNVVELTAAASTTVTYAAVGWGTSDVAKVQSAITDIGAHGHIYIAPNLNLFLGGTNLVTTAEGQSIYSEGNGAALISGGIEIFNMRGHQGNLRLIGPGTHGLNITDPSLQQFDLNPNDALRWWTQNRAVGLRIWDKTYGIYNAVAGQANAFLDVRTCYCATGAYINHGNHYSGYAGAGGTGSATGDSGDWNFNSCWFYKGAIGLHVVKNGGLRLTDTKIQSCSNIGFLIETTGVNPPTYGVYTSNLCIEDCTNYTLKVSSTSATSTLWPRFLQFVGGTMHGAILLDKCKNVVFDGTFINLYSGKKITINSNASTIQFVACGGNGALKDNIDGAGTDYVIYDQDPTVGPYIKSGARVTLIDSTGTKYL